MSGQLRDLDEFYPWVLPFAKGCPDPVADQKIVQAAREFCERTRLWREQFSFAARTTATSVLAAEEYAVVMEIDQVWFNGSQLTPEQYTSRDPALAPEDLVVSQIGPNELRLKSQQEGTFTILLFLKPKPDADTLPDFLFSNFAETIANGALAHIFAMHDRTWANGALAQFHREEYRKVADKHFRGNTRGQQRAPSKMRGQFF